MIKQIPSSEIQNFVKENPKSVLLDVRTKEEWDQIGKPDGDKIGIKTYFLSLQFQGRIINEYFTKAIGAEVDKSEKGLGIRSSRYTMLIENEIVKKFEVEKETATCELSAAENFLNKI